MDNAVCRRRFDDVRALLLRAAGLSPRGRVGWKQGPEVSAMFDSDSADYEHTFTQWPPGIAVFKCRSPKVPF